MSSTILEQVSAYYTNKINEFGVSPRGVDWNSEQSQTMRFEKLCNLLPSDQRFSLLDFGCGYGALYDFLKPKYKAISYTGYDISEKMIEAAQAKYPDSNCVWIHGNPTLLSEFDYVVASGIFNVKLDQTYGDWQDYIEKTIDQMNVLSNKGFSFNILTKYSDAEFMKDHLYYADPCYYFDYCKTKFAKNIALLHDYDLYEFTILVRK
ncbi:MAG TPA: class I SAM-dependent methyltransferase [Bacteroidia bacterium]|nr:class I SAM-dependent methyltransferase [bacterium]HNO70578.1 class I SAM-dependent methyltransferase [Bacteroidia bacterium]